VTSADRDHVASIRAACVPAGDFSRSCSSRRTFL
jgi:hypothetical protein